jgi:hypothetical protein
MSSMQLYILEHQEQSAAPKALWGELKVLQITQKLTPKLLL